MALSHEYVQVRVQCLLLLRKAPNKNLVLKVLIPETLTSALCTNKVTKIQNPESLRFYRPRLKVS